MKITITSDQLMSLGLDQPSAMQLFEKINILFEEAPTAEKAWSLLSQQVFAQHYYPFPVHLFIFQQLFPHWHQHPETAPACLPTAESLTKANISQFMHELNMHDVKTFHQWTIQHYEAFWQKLSKKLNIQFQKPPQAICNLDHGIESPQWFYGAKLNIADSCFNAPAAATAIIYRDRKNQLVKMTYAELNQLSKQIANSLLKRGLMKGDAIAIAMPMNQYAIAIYLGIIKMGGVVVSIADSFSSKEMAVRLAIANTKAVFTQDFIHWSGKKLPLFQKLSDAHSPHMIVLPCEEKFTLTLRDEDMTWNQFLIDEADFISEPCDPMSPCNILFSSGTTGEPKAIVWNHTTPIKAASDAFFHQNIQANDILAWPTNLGWMMGPWLVYAALINQATLALYADAPKDQAFGEFIQQANVTMLGVVPTLVATWRQTNCMEKLNWQSIKVFSSSGECSNPEDMLYLMSLAHYKPVIEYCGGTEIGGAYISSTIIEKNYPAIFTTTVMGSDFIILDEEGNAADLGEVALIPPSLGLSTELLNANHHQIYFADMPTTQDGKILRRHGDLVKRFENGTYSILGRVDDTMNLGGIKTSSAEIERIMIGIPDIIEVAAIAVPPPDNGPSQLIIYAATTAQLDKQIILKEMQKRIYTDLNPLFKIHDVIFINELPKTASNKIMRRVLRKNYLEKIK